MRGTRHGWRVALAWVAACAAACGDGSVVLQPFTNGDFRWRDVAGNAYGAAFSSGYSYTQAAVTVTFRTNATVLSGRLTATGLKPFFAYQLKLSGRPEVDPAGNERLGFFGRWWQETWDGSAWSSGANLNDKGDGSSPNPNDQVYLSRRDVADATSPTGRRYRFVGYRPFAYFITDAAGAASFDFAVLSTYHVLWRTNQRAAASGDGTVQILAFDPAPAQVPAYETDYPPSAAGVFGEWERLPDGGIPLSPGDYTVDFLVTEESFHGVDGAGSGNWAHAAAAEGHFAILPPHLAWPTALDLGGGWKWLAWFGFFHDGFAPWIYHNEHHWMYTSSTSTADLWFWTQDMGWLWTSATTYPCLYRNSDGAWLWYQKDSVSPRWFYNFANGSWEPR